MKNKFHGYRYLGCTGTSEKEERLNGRKNSVLKEANVE
jgi:hypothetical protein